MAQYSGMVICFNASREAQGALTRLQGTGRYTDLSATISAAICNLEVLDSAVAKEGKPLVNPQNQTLTQSPPPFKGTPGAKEIPLLKRPAPHSNAEKIVSRLVAVDQDSALLPPKLWPWGQFNKILPVKICCRATLNLLLQNPSIKIGSAAAAITTAAAELAQALRKADEASHRRRDETFAAALPTSADPEDKSFVRFAEQFVFGTGSFADISYPLVLRLLDCSAGTLRLTDAGLRFAELKNPLLDGELLQSSEKFSKEELALLLAHIRTEVAPERSALTAILTAVKNGASNPDAVDAFLRQLFPSETQDLSAPFLATQRTGAISRAVELKLLRRERQGVRVSYVLEPAAELFLSTTQP